MGYELGLPTNFYHYTSSFAKGYNTGSQTYVPDNNNDNGVFVEGIVTGTTHPGYCPPSPFRGTVVSSKACGSTNMETVNSLASANRILLCQYNTGNGGTVSLQLHRSPSTNMHDIATSPNLLSKFGSGNSMKSANGTLTVHKTEVACPFSWTDSHYGDATGECVYATGISAIMVYDDGSRKDQTVIIARVPSDGIDYPTLYKEPSSTSWSKNGSVIFYGDGSIETGCVISGDNLSGITSATISTAFPEAAMVANNGIIAVSCMVNADGVARWVGYKNGIYKLYNGSKPLYGMPGEKVTVNGHDFVSLAYSPFYARLS